MLCLFSQAITFVRALVRPECIEYIEEPLQDPTSIPDLYQQSGRVVRFALDESLIQLPRPLPDLVSLEGLSALVVKPTILGGMSACLHIHSLGSAKGLTTVVSSSFESSIGLSHLAILASVLNPSFVLKGGQSIMHGLCTYDIFATTISTIGDGASSPSSVSAPSTSSTATNSRNTNKDRVKAQSSTSAAAAAAAAATATSLSSLGFGALVHGEHLLVDVLGCQELLDAHVRRRTRHRSTTGGEEEELIETTSKSKHEETVTASEEGRVATPERAGVERFNTIDSLQ